MQTWAVAMVAAATAVAAMAVATVAATKRPLPHGDQRLVLLVESWWLTSSLRHIQIHKLPSAEHDCLLVSQASVTGLCFLQSDKGLNKVVLSVLTVLRGLLRLAPNPPSYIWLCTPADLPILSEEPIEFIVGWF